MASGSHFTEKAFIQDQNAFPVKCIFFVAGCPLTLFASYRFLKTDSASFIPQSFDRIKLGGFIGRVVPEEHADRH